VPVVVVDPPLAVKLPLIEPDLSTDPEIVEFSMDAEPVPKPPPPVMVVLPALPEAAASMLLLKSKSVEVELA
jgi:hypothetical protein